jgi:uncharacterized protein YeaO (DUF488 family)
MTHGELRLKRIYEPASEADGQRVLVDRIWPRGVKREAAALDEWLKAIAPSTELRKWFGHDPARWEEFVRRYGRELDGNRQAVDHLRAMLAQGDVTLLYGARDETHNQAQAIARYLRRHSGA